MATAKSWDSYMDTLLTVLDEMRPKTVLEYGTGKSSQVMALYPSVELVFAIEHDKDWMQRLIAAPIYGLTIKLVENLDEYPFAFPKDTRFDLIFVDGKNRAACMNASASFLNKHGVMILHDAQRPEYQEAINVWPFKIWTDDGSTVCLMKNELTYKRLSRVLESLKNVIGVRS